MKPSILVVMLDFLVCSLLLFVIGTGGKQTRFATSAAPTAVHEEFSPSAIETMQQQWNRDYEQQSLLASLSTRTTENEQLRSTVQTLAGRLDETAATLTAREQEAQALKTQGAQREETLRALDENLKSLSAEKAKIEQTLSATETQLLSVSTEKGRLQQERAELQQRAQQLGQTVASQQSTIQVLSEDVRAAQVKMETQFAGFARDQQQMAATLGRLDDFARTLPATMQSNVADAQFQQRTMQDNIAALDQNFRNLQADLQEGERSNLLSAIVGVAAGQQQIESQMADLIKAQNSGQITQGLGAIQSGQDALRQQTARLAEQVEAIQARKPGPFQAFKRSRLELLASIVRRSNYDSSESRRHFATYPPVVKVGDRMFIVANDQSLGLTWALGTDFSLSEIADLRYTASRREDPPWSMPLDGAACLLADDRHVVVVELTRPMPGLAAMEITGPETLFRSDSVKLYVFKSTAAGLSFEVETSPDLAAPNYLVVKRPLRGVASWFENPAYRPDAGDFVATADGKLVGIMVNREKCFILSKDNILSCAVSVPLSDKQQFARAAQQFQKLR